MKDTTCVRLQLQSQGRQSSLEEIDLPWRSTCMGLGWPFPPISPRHSHFLQPHQGMTMSSSLAKAFTFPPVLPRNGCFLWPHQGMAVSSNLTKTRTFLQLHQSMDISSSLAKAQIFPPVSPKHGHVLQPHPGLAMSSELARHGHFLQAVQTTRAQHSHTQPPPSTALQNQILVAGKLPSNALSLSPGKWFKLAACELDKAQCLCVTEP